MSNFGHFYCHTLVAFAWCRRPAHITLPDGYRRLCYMDYERGRMYYKEHLLDAQGNFELDKNGNYVFVKVYLQVDHLNGIHDDCNAENLEYVTSQENSRRIRVCNELRKKGLDPKSMTYQELQKAFKINP